jgi:hypothetical protein
MKRSTAALIFLAVGTAVAVFNWWGGETDGYDRFFWYDIVAHVAGGFWIAFGYRLTAQYFRLERWGITPSLGMTLGCVLVVGLLWEWYEVLIGFPLFPAGNEYDVVYDIINDLIGGYLGAVWPRLVTRRAS